MPDIQVIEVQEEQKPVLRQLIELYEYDFSEFNDRDVNAFGRYEYRYLDHYWTDEGRYPFFVLVDGAYGGFLLVNSHCYLQKSGSSKSIAEFFIMRKYRKQGIGGAVAAIVFDKFKGDWEVLQHGDNVPSQIFWQKVIAAYTSGSYQLSTVETESWVGQGYTFNNASKS
ncbi:GNAT family N-acetyltransferase [Paenibacillus daejeonensis]|uniref:GNAT family N-acetyltransferase n=1 Tax=Paenibacillus daejeonensis TaxID=135193 RepID=UPI000376E4B4|nr:hypothetical protein [Paenibacillus daejeonensis]